jgi:hypothetical protein
LQPASADLLLGSVFLALQVGIARQMTHL